ncbi:MAG: DHA2 family efflux MFS transporter permease subunit [Solirubrobacteraceae bacterium]
MSSRRTTLSLVLVAVFMLLLDISVVVVALPDIRTDLGASFGASQWILDAYALALATLLLPAASLADLRGRKRAYLFGLALFTLASLACALAPSVDALSVARAIQGVGGAIVFATALPLIGAAYPNPRERAGAVAAFGATVAVAIAVGPLIGGALTEAFGWQAIFLINLPVGLAALAIASRRLVESADMTHRQRLDIAGMVLLGVGLFALVFATVRGNVEGWDSAIIVGGFAAAAVLLVAFLVVERRRKAPMVDLTLFRSPAFTAAGASVLALGALVGAFVPLTVFLQLGLGHGALRAGAELLPISVASFIAAALTARVLAPRLGLRWLLAGGLALVAVGLALMTLVRDDPSLSALVPGMILAGLGWGAINVSATELALDAVEPARAGMATGVLNVLRQIGVAAGIAALGAIFESASDGGSLAGASADAFLVGAVITGLAALAVGALAAARAEVAGHAPAHPTDQGEMAA